RGCDDLLGGRATLLPLLLLEVELLLTLFAVGNVNAEALGELFRLLAAEQIEQVRERLDARTEDRDGSVADMQASLAHAPVMPSSRGPETRLRALPSPRPASPPGARGCASRSGRGPRRGRPGRSSHPRRRQRWQSELDLLAAAWQASADSHSRRHFRSGSEAERCGRRRRHLLKTRG